MGGIVQMRQNSKIFHRTAYNTDTSKRACHYDLSISDETEGEAYRAYDSGGLATS
jgi:hypothetical protein